MKIKVSSDWHCEFRNMAENHKIFASVLSGSWDVLILAGDIGSMWMTRAVLGVVSEFCKENDRQCFYVPGNHEFYGSTSETKYKGKLYRKASDPEFNSDYVTTLNREVCAYKGIFFAGCVGWHLEKDDCNPIEQEFSTFRKTQGRLDYAFMSEIVKNNSADVIITHYLPHPRSIHEKYKTDPDNKFFYTNMKDLAESTNASLWAHGHTHMPCDYSVNDTRVVCAPVGYPGENADINPGKIVRVAT